VKVNLVSFTTVLYILYLKGLTEHKIDKHSYLDSACIIRGL
jgi:hypothetical protein